jgi:hypothetical protein
MYKAHKANKFNSKKKKHCKKRSIQSCAKFIESKEYVRLHLQQIIMLLTCDIAICLGIM